MSLKSRARILVVDDEARARESLRMILAPHFSVETATGASDAALSRHARRDGRGSPGALLGEAGARLELDKGAGRS